MLLLLSAVGLLVGGGELALNLLPKFVFMWLLICEWYVKRRKKKSWVWQQWERKPTLKYKTGKVLPSELPLVTVVHFLRSIL